MRRSLPYRLPAVLALGLGLFWAVYTRADVTDSTPYNYVKVPAPGREGGTYAFTSYGALGAPGCTGTAIGAAKLLPNAERTGGSFCAKFNIQSEAGCPLAPGVDPTLIVVGGTYTLNGDGTLCENTAIIGGPLDGTPTVFHTYIDPKGKWLLASTQDIAYGCPDATIPDNGPLIANAVALKISELGDDPPGSGTLPCTNP